MSYDALMTKRASKLFVHGPNPDFGKLVPVEIKSVTGGPYIAKLADGTQLELRTLIVEAKRSLNRHDAQGDPVYQVGTAQVIKARVPRKLKKRA